MSCKRLDHVCEPAPILHRALCAECRRGRTADRMVGLLLDCVNAEPIPTDGPARVLRALSIPSANVAMSRLQRRRAADRLWRRAALTLVTFVIAASAWLWHIDRDPGIRVPEPRMPSPNAFNHFRSAGLALTMDDEIGKAAARPSGPRPAPVVPLHKLEEMVKRNAEALRLVRAGFAHEYREPPIRSFSQALPHYAKDRGLARLLRVEAMLHERKGHIAQANASDLDAVELGMRIRKGGTVIGALVGCACTAIGRVGLWNRLDRMSAEEARGVLSRLDRIEALHTPVADNLAEEKWSGVAGLIEIMSAPDWRWKLGDLTSAGDPSENERLRNLIGYVVVLPYSKKAILERYQRNLDEQVEYARAFPLRPKPSPRLNVDPLDALLYPLFASLVMKDAIERCAHGLLRVSLAMRAYEIEKGKPPRNLIALVEAGYMERIPNDPFLGNRSSIRSRPGMKGLVVYSVGPDRVDNGGVPIGRKMAFEKDMSCTVMEDSIGDIVAGVNTP